MKKSLCLVSVLGLLLLSGCGDDSTSLTSEPRATGNYDVTVERGPLLNAFVMDAGGHRATEVGRGVYRFDGTPAFPVSAVGGIIDLDRDGTISAGDAANPVALKAAKGNAVTMLSTLASTAPVRTWLKETFSLTDEQIDQATPSTDRVVAAIGDELFAYCIENGVTDPSRWDVEQLRTNLQNRISMRIQSYVGSGQSVAELEIQLLETLGMDRLTTDMLTNPPSGEGMDGLIAMVTELPAYELTSAQKYTLAYMWNEEKMAKDLYLTLNGLTPHNTLVNIATRSETQHQAAVEALLRKYDLNIEDLENYAGGFSSDALSRYGSGQFSIIEVQNLYDSLYQTGRQSLQHALEAGCRVEVTDVEDLDRDIATAEGVLDLVLVYSALRSGSYNHYWAFDRALKNIGVEAGCCSLGERYCKTENEFPLSKDDKRKGF